MSRNVGRPTVGTMLLQFDLPSDVRDPVTGLRRLSVDE